MGIFDNRAVQWPFRVLLKPFYRNLKGFNPFHVLWAHFFPQKVLRVNGRVPWPVHFTSRVLYHRRITVGNFCAPGANSGCYVQGRNGIVMGHNVVIGPNVGLISSNHDPCDYSRWIPGPPITIGSNVWIGMNAVVLPGVTIGDNVVIGANAVVTGNIPPDSVAAGVPCRVIRTKEPYRGIDYGAL